MHDCYHRHANVGFYSIGDISKIDPKVFVDWEDLLWQSGYTGQDPMKIVNRYDKNPMVHPNRSECISVRSAIRVLSNVKRISQVIISEALSTLRSFEIVHTIQYDDSSSWKEISNLCDQLSNSI